MLLLLPLSRGAGVIRAQGREVPPGPGGTGPVSPSTAWPRGPGAPCTAGSVQLQRGRGIARICPVSCGPPGTSLTQAPFLDGCVRHPQIHAGVMFSLTVTPSLTTRPFLLKELMHDTGCLGLVHWDDPEGCYGGGGGRRVQGGEHMYT